MEYEEHSQADENFYIIANKLIELSSRAWELFESSELEEKQQLLNFLLQNSYLQGKNALFELKNPFSGILEYAKSGSLLRTLNEIRTFFSENPNAEFWSANWRIKLGRAKRKGVGGKEFLPALAFRFQFFSAAEFRASETGAPPTH